MPLPLSYNLRNLVVRRTTTVMTAAGIGLTVAVLLGSLALVEGLRTSLRATGHPLHVLVMRKGTTAELTSTITREVFQDLKCKPGIAQDASGQPMASLEMVTVISDLEPGGGSRRSMNANLRGLLPAGVALRDRVRIVAGRMFEPGRREVVVGKAIADRHPAAGLGRSLRFGRGLWVVVGIMDGGRSAVNSEIFADLNQVSTDFGRPSVLSSVLLRATDAGAVPRLIRALEDDTRLNVAAMTESQYYELQTQSAAPIQFLGIFVASIMAVGSSFAAMNTMYAAVARRSAEIGTLRVLGFSSPGILIGFLLESVLLSLLGGVMGCLLVLPLNHFTTRVGSSTTFSDLSFELQVSVPLLLAGLGFALVMGVAGGLFPARAAARKEILDALRDA